MPDKYEVWVAEIVSVFMAGNIASDGGADVRDDEFAYRERTIAVCVGNSSFF